MTHKRAPLLILLGILIGCAAAQLAPRVAEAQAPAAAAAVADAVEYRIVTWNLAPGAEAQRKLNELGAQGWQVRESLSSPGGGTAQLLLMRTKR